MIYSFVRWGIDPEIMNIFGVSVRYYSLLFMGGLFISFEIAKEIFKRQNFHLKNVENLFMYGVIGVLLGARLGHCLFYEFEYYSKHILDIFIPFRKINGLYVFTGFSGLASHGGFIGLFTAILLYCRKYKLNLLKILDVLAIVSPLGAAFIRIGNFMNSEIIGRETHLPWAVVFSMIDDVPRHPSQLYEAISYILIFIFLLIFYRNNNSKVGTSLFLGIALLLTFTSRFLIEFIKINQVEFEEGLPLNMGQVLSIPMMLIGILLIIRLKLRYSPKL